MKLHLSPSFRFSLSLLVALMLGVTAPLAYGQPQPSDATSDEDLKAVESGEKAEIHVKNADIASIIKIFSKKTRRNYILDERVKGKVSLYIPGKVSPSESLRILEALLSLKGFTSVPVGENLWKIVPSKEAKQTTIPTRSENAEEPATAAMVTQLVKLNYVGAEEAQQLVSQLISPDGLANAYAGTNSLIIIDSEDNVQRIVKILEEIDLPFSDRDMTIIPIQYADAKDIADKLNELLGDDSKSTSKGGGQTADAGFDLLRARLRESSMQPPGSPPQSIQNASATSASRSASSEATAARTRAPKITADERTNSIIVVADDDTTSRIRALISKLDSKLDMSGFRFYVYRCQHASAEELATVLSGLSGGSSSGGSSSSGSGSSSGGDVSSSFGGSGSSSGSRTQSRMSGQKRTPGQSRQSSSDSSGVGTVNLGENVSITADPATNSLVISASKTDYMKIRSLLDELDVKRRQVLVEAMLLEVAVTDDQSLGTEFMTSTGGADGGILAKSDFGNLSNLLSDPTKLSNFSIAAASSGTLSLPGDISIPTQAVLLSAAQSNENVNVLSSPTILATDNEQAEIVVGENVPFVTSTSTSETNLNNTFNQVERQDVGITLRLTPQISSGDFVTLQIFTEVSNVKPQTQGSPLGPTTSVKTSETKVITKSGQMVVIGGLMSDDITETQSGVPFFQDIPVIGSAFRTTRERRQRRNLLIFITPRIIEDQFDAREATIERRDKLQGDINAYELFPPREEVLHSVAIDRVSEAATFNGEKPTTIRVPQNGGSSSTSNRVVANGDGAISLKVTPRIPAVPGSLEAPKASGFPQTPSPATGSDRYVVLELGPLSPEAKAKLPFSLSNNSKYVGVLLSGESSVAARNFFVTGRKYTYAVEGEQIHATTVGIFGSAQDAQSIVQEVSGEWYTPSPYEIMSLGSGPWRKAE